MQSSLPVRGGGGRDLSKTQRLGYWVYASKMGHSNASQVNNLKPIVEWLDLCHYRHELSDYLE